MAGTLLHDDEVGTETKVSEVGGRRKSYLLIRCALRGFRTNADDAAEHGQIPLGIPHARPPLVSSFRDLDVWQQAMLLTEAVYHSTEAFPRAELFGITSQVRRAAVSMAANIAEGHCRRTTRAYLNHVSIALGSHGELSTLIELSARLGYLSVTERRHLEASNELVGRLLYGLHRSLSARIDGQR